jgi:hypothetical protein
LELGRTGLRLVGSDAVADVAEELAYDDVSSVRVGRRHDERIDGLRTVVVERCDGDSLSIAGIVEPGLIGEVAERLTALQRSHARRHVAVVLPLVPGCRDAVELLVADGPPFDAATVGLERHCVFVTDDEAVFVFAWRGDGSPEALLAERGRGDGAAAWQDYAAGPPRIAEPAYTWVRPRAAADAAVLPPGLHA